MPTINKLSLDGILYDFGGGIDTGDATAVASDILLGKTAYARGFKLEGTIPLLEETVYTPKNTDQTIESGKYLNGNQIIKGDPNLLAENILKDISIFGITGGLDILLLAGGLAENNSNPGSKVFYWNGSQYVADALFYHKTWTFVGTPKLAAAYANGSWSGNTIGGNNFNSTLKFFTSFTNKTFSTQQQIGMQIAAVVLGIK